MGTYRTIETIDIKDYDEEDIKDLYGNDYVLESDALQIIDKIESDVDDAIYDIERYDVLSALETLKKLKEKLY